MNDLKPFKHGEEGTHSICNKHNIGGKSICCKCSGEVGCGDEPMIHTDKILEEFDEKLHIIARNCWANINISLQKHGAKFKGNGMETAYAGWVALNEILLPRVSFLLSTSIQQAVAEERDLIQREVFDIIESNENKEMQNLRIKKIFIR